MRFFAATVVALCGAAMAATIPDMENVEARAESVENAVLTTDTVAVENAAADYDAMYHGFTQSCSRITFYSNNQQLQASCADVQGNYHTTTINLNDCIDNNNGNAACNPSGGNFGQSCRNYGLQSQINTANGNRVQVTTITMECRGQLPIPADWIVDDNSRWQYHKTSTNLDDCVGNQDGRLQCR